MEPLTDPANVPDIQLQEPRPVSAQHERHHIRPIVVAAIVFACIVILYLVYPQAAARKVVDMPTSQAVSAVPVEVQPDMLVPIAPEPAPAAPERATTHIETPATVRALYVSGWMAGTTNGMAHIYTLIDGGEINAVVIDIKDATGRLSYQPLDPALLASGVGTKRIAHLDTLIEELHRRNIYVIGRVSAMQDPYLAGLKSEYAFNDTRTGGAWRDNKGLMWLRPDHQGVWDYLVAISRDAHAQGFDEINLDYVRFPSDGPIAYLDTASFAKSRADTMEDFFKHMSTELREESGIPLSADIFGLATSATGDLGIGQVIEKIAPHVDYVAPMMYPSHYAAGSFGIADPAANPGAVISRAVSDGIKRLAAIGIDKSRLRPWLQDFDLGAIYTAELVQAQIAAARAQGIDSYLMWDPANRYTAEVYK